MKFKKFTNKKEAESSNDFTPHFNEDGLIACITTSHIDNQVLMFAYMNAESLALTLDTKEMHYWSRSRSEIWHKGKTSGDVQRVIHLSVDCDQDCLLAVVEVTSKPETSCHTGRRSCFYRSVCVEDTPNGKNATLAFLDENKSND